jgi:hypothetical protein
MRVNHRALTVVLGEKLNEEEANGSLTLFNSTGGSSCASNGKGKSKKTGSELHLEDWMVLLRRIV